MANTLDTCGDGCGWIAGIVAAVAYGSFGVPVRHTKHIDVHPLVLQTFKTVTMFVLSWFVMVMHVTPSWTWWGLASGTLWVLGGTGGIYAIRMAGLAVAVGVWASVMIAVNFVWGILVFHEPIHDIPGTLAAFLLLTLGLVGMSLYAAPDATAPKDNIESSVEMERNAQSWDKENDDEQYDTRYDRLDNPSSSQDALAGGLTNSQEIYDKNRIVFDCYNIQLTERQAGIAGAVFNGLMTGSSLIPLHYAKAQGYGGANFMISMATGALISNVLLWILIYLYQCRQVSLARRSDTASPSASADDFASSVSTLTDSEADFPGFLPGDSVIKRAYDSMPVWHFRELTIPGTISGILLTVAMFGSILSVTYLGQGIGNSIVQTKILVSGLWGIFWFGEIRGCGVVSKWFLSASLTVLGIVWLSYERLLATNGQAEGH